LIQISRIECVSAAGNYVEIVERGQRYLLRATLKQVEDLLPATEFIRIHRCHLVRRDEIERIKSQPSGNGTVHLRGGQALPMSKKHKQALQRYRAVE
jgi:DNA-binding LytR/AlgR family response regulator